VFAGSYTTDRLRDLFGKRFLVEDVILKDSRKKKKASALVVLDSMQAAGQAAHEVLGDLKNPLLITPYLKVMPEAADQQQQQQQRSPAAAAAAAGGDGGGRKPAAPLFAVGGVGAGSAGKPVQRPSKPLFPSK
jgi:DnaJ family protein C protein 17